MKTSSYSKSILAGMIGTMIEWYDYGLFGFLAPVLAQLFFPAANPWMSLLQAFMVFAIGYFLRPIGGMFFGSIADRFGRVTALRSTILLASLPSLAIACLPTYAIGGFSSQLLLVFLRLLQGLSVGGEFAGSMVYLTEIAPPRFRVLFSGFTNNASDIGVLLGVGLCSLLSLLLSHDAFYSYGWRIPFFVGGILGIVGFRLRKVFMESQAFLDLQKEKRLHTQPLRAVLRLHLDKLLLGTLLCCMGACGTYTLHVYLSTYLSVVKGYPAATALSLQSFLVFITLILVPIASLLTHHYPKISMLKWAALGNLLYALFGFMWLPTDNIVLTGCVLFPLIIFIAIEQGLMPSTLAELFPTAIRYTGVSICYNLSYAYIGGAAPMYLTWLISKFHNPLMPAYCLMITSTVTGFALLKLAPQKNFSEELLADALPRSL